MRQHESGIWIRDGQHGKQDLDVVREVWSNDGYYLRLRQNGGPGAIVVDIGAHIGTFARKWHAQNPDSRIVCVEACPENIPVLEKNVGEFATVIHAACTYEAGPLELLNSVKNGGTATGGSTVIPAGSSGDTFGHLYWLDRRPLETVTLEQIMEQMGVDRIDVLKIDAEGSEFSILRNTPSLDRIGFLCGEYHGRQQWEELLRDKFQGWDYGHMFTSGNLGIFHLVNPAGSKV